MMSTKDLRLIREEIDQFLAQRKPTWRWDEVTSLLTDMAWLCDEVKRLKLQKGESLIEAEGCQTLPCL